MARSRRRRGLLRHLVVDLTHDQAVLGAPRPPGPRSFPRPNRRPGSDTPVDIRATSRRLPVGLVIRPGTAVEVPLGTGGSRRMTESGIRRRHRPPCLQNPSTWRLPGAALVAYRPRTAAMSRPLEPLPHFPSVGFPPDVVRCGMEMARIVLGLEEHDVAEEVMHFLDRTGRARIVATASDDRQLSEAVRQLEPDAVVASTGLVTERLLGAFLALETAESVRSLRSAIRFGASGYFVWPRGERRSPPRPPVCAAACRARRAGARRRGRGCERRGRCDLRGHASGGRPGAAFDRVCARRPGRPVRRGERSARRPCRRGTDRRGSGAVRPGRSARADPGAALAAPRGFHIAIRWCIASSHPIGCEWLLPVACGARGVGDRGRAGGADAGRERRERAPCSRSPRRAAAAVERSWRPTSRPHSPNANAGACWWTSTCSSGTPRRDRRSR